MAATVSPLEPKTPPPRAQKQRGGRGPGARFEALRSAARLYQGTGGDVPPVDDAARVLAVAREFERYLLGDEQ